MGAYLRGYNGVNPKVGIKLWNMYDVGALKNSLTSYLTE
jgi:hypothetical protein